MYKILGAILIISVFSCQLQENRQDDKEAIKSVERSNYNVEAVILKPRTFSKQIIANGKIESHSKANLRFKKQDRISKIFVRNGQFVKKGTILASLDNYLIKNLIKKAKINLKNAQWEKKKLLLEYNLSDTSTSPSLDYINTKSGYYEAKSRVENLKLQLEETLLKAPFNGVISNLTTKQGNFSNSSEPFCTLISKNNPEAVFYILDTELQMVDQGEKTEIIPFSMPDKKYKGILTEINPQVDDNGLIRVKSTILNADNKLMEGMNVKIILNKTTKNSLVIPKSALVLRSGKEVVFTLKNDSLAQWNYVKTTGENSEYYAVSKGLNIGDTIIVSNNMNLSHDARVKAKLYLLR